MGKLKHRGAASEADVIAPLALLSAARAAARVAPAAQGAEAYERRFWAARRRWLAATREATAEATATAAGAWAAEAAAATAASQVAVGTIGDVAVGTIGDVAVGTIEEPPEPFFDIGDSVVYTGLTQRFNRSQVTTGMQDHVVNEVEVDLEEAEDVAAAVDRADCNKWEWGSRVVWWESSYTWSKPELACASWESEPEWHRNARSEEADARWNRDG